MATIVNIQTREETKIVTSSPRCKFCSQIKSRLYHGKNKTKLICADCIKEGYEQFKFYGII